MDEGWFERLTGFGEDDYERTRGQLVIEDGHLVSTTTGERRGTGELTMPTLSDLRGRAPVPAGRHTTVECMAADVADLHAQPEFEHALFQVASQFNLLEMVSPDVSPEDGVTRYIYDPTQGPACALAAGAATIYRNYCVPLGEGTGQTRDRQLNMLSDMGSMFGTRLCRPVSELWTMRNGYALATGAGLAAITDLLADIGDEQRDAFRATLAVGLHRDVEATNTREGQRRFVSQVFCSALPVRYSDQPAPAWEAFARLVLEAAYEATLLAAVEQANTGASKTVLLTRLGGGAFGNDDEWIDAAILRALHLVENAGLDVRLVSYGRIDPAMRAIAERWAS